MDGVEYSNFGVPMEIPVPYMHALVAALEKAGYVRGRTLRAATCDHPPVTHAILPELKIEDAVYQGV